MSPELSESIRVGRGDISTDCRCGPRLSKCAHRIIFIAGLLAMLTAIFILSPLQNLVYARMDAQDRLVRADYIICLGGDHSRVFEATRLLRDGYAPTMIVSNVGEAAERMRRLAVEWGAPADRVLMDDASRRTSDHPAAVANLANIDIKNDRCIIVTSYAHLARARAVFEAAGYRHLIMQEPRWERESRPADGPGWRGRFLVFPRIVYEGAAWALYWIRGSV